MSILRSLKTKTQDLQTKRSYTQLEKDMIQKFYDNTTMQIQKKNEEVYQVESKMQQMENNHQLEIRMYLQKVKHLELEKEKTRDMTMKDATNLQQNEDKFQENRLGLLKTEKLQLKDTYVDMEKTNEYQIAGKEEEARQIFESIEASNKTKLDDLEKEYKKELSSLRSKLELKLKVTLPGLLRPQFTSN